MLFRASKFRNGVRNDKRHEAHSIDLQPPSARLHGDGSP